MTSASQLPLPRQVFYNTNGEALNGGLVSTYVPGTTTPIATYQDNAEGTINANPITLDAAGSCLIYGNGAYQLTVTDALGNAVPGYSGVTYTPPSVSPAMAPVIEAATVTQAFNLLAVNGGTIGSDLTVLGSLTVSGSLSFTNVLGPAVGGTGTNTLTQNAVLIGNGTGSVTGILPGASGNILTSNGTVWQAEAFSSAGVISFNGRSGVVALETSDWTAAMPITPLALGTYTYARFFVASTPFLGQLAAGSVLYNLSTLSPLGASGTWLCVGPVGTYEPPTCCTPTVYASGLFLRVA